jgi:hypothetical protein
MTPYTQNGSVVYEEWLRLRRSMNQVIPVGAISQREFTRRMRMMVDFIKDPENRYTDPQTFASYFSRIVILATTYPEMFEATHVKHNLGIKRIKYIKEIILA